MESCVPSTSQGVVESLGLDVEGGRRGRWRLRCLPFLVSVSSQWEGEKKEGMIIRDKEEFRLSSSQSSLF